MSPSRAFASVIGAFIMALLAVSALRVPPFAIVVRLATKLAVLQKLFTARDPIK
jgi:hypothetical protein